MSFAKGPIQNEMECNKARARERARARGWKIRRGSAGRQRCVLELLSGSTEVSHIQDCKNSGGPFFIDSDFHYVLVIGTKLV